MAIKAYQAVDRGRMHGRRRSGIYRDKDGEWTIYFNRKASGFMIPVKIRMDSLPAYRLD